MARGLANRQLYRVNDACLGGVCGGIAARYEIDPIAVRLMAVILSLVTVGIGAIVYIVLWVTLPQESQHDDLCEITPEQAESSAYGSMDLASLAPANEAHLSFAVRIVVAVCLALLFLVVATGVSPLVPGSHWWQFWPVGLVIGGLFLVIMPVADRFAMQWHAAGIVLVALAISCLPMSLGIMSWETFASAFSQMWPIIVLAAVLFVLGMRRENGALAVAAALVVVAFCFFAVANYAVPGEVAHLLVTVPGGRSLRIAVAQIVPFI